MRHRILTLLAAATLLAVNVRGQAHLLGNEARASAAAQPATQEMAIKIEGDVVDNLGQGISGAMVTSFGKSVATTNQSGHFVLQVVRPPASCVVFVSKLDYTFRPEQITVPCTPKGNITNIRFTGKKTPPKK